MIEIKLEGISKTYNPGLFKKKIQAVRDLNLEIRQGEVFGLIGPNGAGKSSTIRMLLGLSRPDSGTILFRGHPIGTSIKEEIGYLPENPYLYDHLSLAEMLAFCGRVSGLDKDVIERRGRELVRQLDLASAFKRPLRSFSKGMLQRAGICFALLHDPSVVILDEPMSGLDPLGRRMVLDLVRDLSKQGKTIFFCSHILSDVEQLCDRIGVMVDGRLIQVFGKGQFWHEEESLIHLSVAPLSAEQEQGLQDLVAFVGEERHGHVVSIRPEQLAASMERLGRLGVAVRGSRTEGVSLEELFIQTVEEQRK
jgi:ABC-2 type transport system ATP-binding protein